MFGRSCSTLQNIYFKIVPWSLYAFIWFFPLLLFSSLRFCLGRGFLSRERFEVLANFVAAVSKSKFGQSIEIRNVYAVHIFYKFQSSRLYYACLLYHPIQLFSGENTDYTHRTTSKF